MTPIFHQAFPFVRVGNSNFFENIYSGFTFTHVLPAINSKNNDNIDVLNLYKVVKLVKKEGSG